MDKIVAYSAIVFTIYMLNVLTVNSPSKLSTIKRDLPIIRDEKKWEEL